MPLVLIILGALGFLISGFSGAAWGVLLGCIAPFAILAVIGLLLWLFG